MSFTASVEHMLSLYSAQKYCSRALEKTCFWLHAWEAYFLGFFGLTEVGVVGLSHRWRSTEPLSNLWLRNIFADTVLFTSILLVCWLFLTFLWAFIKLGSYQLPTYEVVTGEISKWVAPWQVVVLHSAARRGQVAPAVVLPGASLTSAALPGSAGKPQSQTKQFQPPDWAKPTHH